MKANKFHIIIAALGVLLFFIHCQKEDLNLQSQEVSSPAEVPLHQIQFVSEDTGFIAGGEKFQKGVLLTTYNGGQTWQKDSILSFACFDLHFFDGREGYIAGFGGKVLHTTDGGTHWQTLQDPSWNGFHTVFFVNRNWGLASGGEGSKFSLIRKTQNGGQHWQRHKFNRGLRDLHFFDESTGLACGYGAVIRTTDGGESWTFTDAQDDLFKAMSFPTAHTGYVIGYTGTILKTTDQGKSWEKVRKGNSLIPERKHFYSIAFWNKDIGYAVGDRGTILYTDDGGNNWDQLSSFTEERLRDIYLTSKNSGWVIGADGGIYQFTKPSKQ
jgi:photosystem II stability/assembly factor-like uncharacterized protein